MGVGQGQDKADVGVAVVVGGKDFEEELLGDGFGGERLRPAGEQAFGGGVAVEMLAGVFLHDAGVAALDGGGKALL